MEIPNSKTPDENAAKSSNLIPASVDFSLCTSYAANVAIGIVANSNPR